MPRGKSNKKVHLTVQSVKSMRSEDPRGTRFYDSEQEGFGVVVYPSGKKSYFIEWGSPRRHRMTVTVRSGTLGPTEARKKAKILLGDILKGVNPLRERKKKVVTFGDWVSDWLKGFRARRKPRTVVEYERYLGVAKDQWGSLPLPEITPTDVRTVLMVMKEKGTTTANRWLAAVRSCLADAAAEGVINANPASRVKPLREPAPRSRTLKPEEKSRFLAAVKQDEDPHARAALLMLDQTGARVREVLTARWEDIDLDAKVWRIPSPKAGHPQVMPIPQATADMLKELPRVGPFIIAGRSEKSPRYDLRGPWRRACKLAGLTDVHMHDLRRTFGLDMSRSAGLHVASKLLRHADVRVTEKVYAPLGLEDLRGALERRNGEAQKTTGEE